MLKYYDIPADEVLKIFRSSEGGLSEAEAEERLKRNGENKLTPQKKKSVIGLFFSQFGDLMTIMLIAAACVSAVIAFLSGDFSDLADTAIIISIILLNAVVGTFQQYRADRAIEKLKKLSSVNAKVRRGGKVREIPAESLCTGDITLLEEGDVVPADIRIINSSSLICGEAALTGEAAGVKKTDKVIAAKNVGYHNAENLAFASTYVLGGRGEGVVIATGAHTEIGGIAGMLNGVKKTDSPLEKGLNRLGKIISAFVVGVAALVFVMGLIAGDMPVIKNFMTAVAVAVAAIPEGLPAVVTVIMAMGVRRMSRNKVIIRKMKCVETLGSCTCICTDKTGTLTCNEMKVLSVHAAMAKGLRDTADEAEGRSGVTGGIYACMAACNNAKESGEGFVGDPTETALLTYIKNKGVHFNFKRKAEVPFSSERKYMAVSGESGGKVMCYVKGAPEAVIKGCAHIYKVNPSGGLTLSPLSDEDRRLFLDECRAYSKRALRTLAFAEKESGDTGLDNLTLLGCCGMMDDLRAGVCEAVGACKRAGISTVMITGDSAETAFAIAKKAGICKNREYVFTGDELDGMTKPALKEAVKKGRVFARVTPRHKNVIVKLKQACGEVVAMTGDGVNDAPAVKSADIGVVMGGSGTEVTKSVADMIITDDNFATIVSGVREGRRISSNIKKTIQFFLSTNLAEVFSILVATFAFFGCGFLTSTQLLWLNLITDSFPVLALGVERGGEDDMRTPPMRVEKALFSPSSLMFILVSSLYITGVTVGIYAVSLKFYGSEVAATAAFITLTFAELFHAFNVRAGAGSAFAGMFSNKTLVATVVIGSVVNVALCLSPAAELFSVEPLGVRVWLSAVGLALSVIPFCEAYKFFTAFALRLTSFRRKNRGVNNNAGITKTEI